MDENTWLVVGLGNPGPGYAGNRHNVGQMVLDELADRIAASFKTPQGERHRRRGARCAPAAEADPGQAEHLHEPLRRPGRGAAASSTRLDARRLIVIHDELDIPFDTVKLKHGGGHGGHNGLRDIIAAIGTPDFTRVRVGIGRPPGRQDAADFVLHDFSSTEKKVLPNLLADAADATEHIVADGLASAQLRFHAPA